MFRSLQGVVSALLNAADKAAVASSMPLVVVMPDGSTGRVHDVVWNSDERRWEMRIAADL